LSQAAGYEVSSKISNLEQLQNAIENFDKNPITTFLHIPVNSEVEENLPRVSEFTKLINRFVESYNA
jgi:hypothetical protein